MRVAGGPRREVVRPAGRRDDGAIERCADVEAEKRLAFYGLLLAFTGLAISMVLGIALPVALAALVLVAAEFVALVLGVTARSMGAGVAAMVVSAALLFAGVVVAVPFASDLGAGTAPGEGVAREMPTGGASDGTGGDERPESLGAAPAYGGFEDPAESYTGTVPHRTGDHPGELFPKVPYEDRKP